MESTIVEYFACRLGSWTCPSPQSRGRWRSAKPDASVARRKLRVEAEWKYALLQVSK